MTTHAQPVATARATRPVRVPGKDEALVIRGLSKHFERDGTRTEAIRGLDLVVREREFVCLVGASGCGKSTLLSIIAGLDTASVGEVDRVGSRPAMLFQEAALFPWLDVRDNVGLPMRLAGVPRVQRRERVDELLALVHLSAFAEHRPHELSGGMKQRVALARALAQDANLLLMDEPFAALDALMRDHLYDELERLVDARGLTVLFVTHNVREAVRLGDRVLVLRSHPGRVVAEFPIAFARPRRIESAEVAETARTILDRLREQSHHVE
jgi:NitT/TauT family transport system ATP-binding protein